MNSRSCFAHRIAVACAAGALCGFSWNTWSAPGITIRASDWERRNAPVIFAVPGSTAAMQIRDDDGKTFPLQIDSNGQASFIIEYLPKGRTKSFQFIAAKPSQDTDSQAIRVARAGRKLKVASAGKTILEYQAEPG